MITNPELLASFEKKLCSKEKTTYSQNLKILDAMWNEGVAFGVLPPKDPLEGIEVDIRVAKAIKLCSGK